MAHVNNNSFVKSNQFSIYILPTLFKYHNLLIHCTVYNAG